jgi:HlyD family secretion protein
MSRSPLSLRLLSPLALVAVIAAAGCNREPSGSGNVRTASQVDLYSVERSDFDMAIPVSGELAAMRQIEVRNRLESRAVITEIVPEGKSVRKGEVVLRLAEEEVREKVKDAKDKVNMANSELIAAEQSLSIKENTRDSELEKADLTVEMAKLALLAWENGELVSKRQSLALARETADIDLARLEDRFNKSSELVEKNFISRDEFEKDRIAMIEARAKSKQAALDQQVFEEYTYKQDRAKKESDVEQAVAERGRVEQKNNAEIVKAKADVESAKFKVESAADRLKNFETQLGYCTVIAPSDGLVVYATSIDSGGGGRGGGDAQPPQVGTECKPNELVIILPDTSQMVANLKVSEALSGRIRPGQNVTVYSDAMPNVPIQGSVYSVSVLAASGGWRDPNRRDYTVKVALNADPAVGLKPSMRCRAEILLDRVDDAIGVPIQAIFRQGPVAYVHIRDGGGYAQRLVKLGRSSELRVEVIEGVKEGDRVLLREPSADELTAKLDFETLQAELAPPPAAQARPTQPAGPAGAAVAEGPEAAPAAGSQGEAGGQGGDAGKPGDGTRRRRNGEGPGRNGSRGNPPGEASEKPGAGGGSGEARPERPQNNDAGAKAAAGEEPGGTGGRPGKPPAGTEPATK